METAPASEFVAVSVGSGWHPVDDPGDVLAARHGLVGCRYQYESIGQPRGWILRFAHPGPPAAGRLEILSFSQTYVRSFVDCLPRSRGCKCRLQGS